MQGEGLELLASRNRKALYWYLYYIRKKNRHGRSRETATRKLLVIARMYFCCVMWCCICQWLRSEINPFIYLVNLKEATRAEIIPGKHSDTRIKPLASSNGHGRYITVTPERMPLSAREWLLHTTVINLQPFRFWRGYVTTFLPLKPPPGFRSGLKYPKLY